MALDLVKFRADLAAVPGEVVAATKSQLNRLIEVAERGQAAERQLAEMQKAGHILVSAA